MSRVTLLKGSDAEIFVNGSPLCGVTKLEVAESLKTYEIYEYLSGEFAERLPLKREYELTLVKAFAKDEPLDIYGEYTLGIRTDGSEEVYTKCKTLAKTNSFTAGSPLTVTYKIRAYSKKEVEGND